MSEEKRAPRYSVDGMDDLKKALVRDFSLIPLLTVCLSAFLVFTSFLATARAIKKLQKRVDDQSEMIQKNIKRVEEVKTPCITKEQSFILRCNDNE